MDDKIKDPEFKDAEKGKPGPKPKVENTASKETEQNPQKENGVKNPEAYQEIENDMVLVDVPVRSGINGTITGYEQKEVSRKLAEQEIAKWEEYKSTGIKGHSAWIDVKFSK